MRTLTFISALLFYFLPISSSAFTSEYHLYLDTCKPDPYCSINYDFTEDEVSSLEGLSNYSFFCDESSAGASIAMTNGDSIYAIQGACNHFWWEAVLISQRDISDFKKEVLDFGYLFERHMSVGNLKTALDNYGKIEKAPEGLNKEIQVRDIHDYLQEFFIFLSEDSQGRTVIRITYYGG